MKAHIARNQNAGVPLALGWNLSPADRGKLEGMAPAFGMKLLLVSPADAGKTVAQLLGEVEVKAPRTLVLEPGAYPPALVLANFRDKDVDTLLDLMRQAQVTIPLKAVVTPANRNWMFADLLAHLQEEHTAFTAAKESQTVHGKRDSDNSTFLRCGWTSETSHSSSPAEEIICTSSRITFESFGICPDHHTKAIEPAYQRNTGTNTKPPTASLLRNQPEV